MNGNRMYLVQITITDVDDDEVVQSESRQCEHYSFTDSSDGFALECGQKRRGMLGGSGSSGAPDWISLVIKVVDALGALKADAERNVAERQAQTRVNGGETELPKSGGCCGE